MIDRADAPAYDDGWQEGDNGGSGFPLPWDFETIVQPAGSITVAVQSSTATGGTGVIDTGGKSFALLTTDNVRDFEQAVAALNYRAGIAVPNPAELSVQVDMEYTAALTPSSANFLVESDSGYLAYVRAHGEGFWSIFAPVNDIWLVPVSLPTNAAHVTIDNFTATHCRITIQPLPSGTPHVGVYPYPDTTDPGIGSTIRIRLAAHALASPDESFPAPAHAEAYFNNLVVQTAAPASAGESWALYE